MKLEVLVYFPFLESEDEMKKGWDKRTIEYIVENRDKVLSKIANIAKKHNINLSSVDIEDIYSNLSVYLYKTEDYNICKAIGESEKIIPLEGYINKCIMHCIHRYISDKSKIEKGIIRDTIQNDDGDLSLFDIIDTKDDSIDNISYNLEDLCNCYEYSRYLLGFDIYLLLYIRLLTINNDEVYENICRVLGLDGSIDMRSVCNYGIMGIVKAITLLGIERSISILEKYVYCANTIKNMVVT